MQKRNVSSCYKPSFDPTKRSKWSSISFTAKLIVGASALTLLSQTTSAAPDSEIGIAKEVSQGPTVLPNGNVSFEYTIRVTNPASFDVENIQVEDDLTAIFTSPANIVTASVTSSDFSIDHSNIADTTLLDGTDDLAAGDSGTITIAVEADFSGENGPFFNTASASGDTICTVGAATTSGARVRLWDTGSQNAPTRFASLALEFNNGIGADGFRVRNANPTINRLSTNFNNVFRGVRDRTREEAGRADGWIASPCLRTGQTWEVRAATGTAFGTYLAAFRSDETPTAADIVTGFTTNFSIGANGTSLIDGEAVGNRVDSALFTATPGLPVGLVLQMDDRGSSNGFAVQERIDGGAWTTIPAARIWEDKPAQSPVIRTLTDISDNGSNPVPTEDNGTGGVDDPTPVSNPLANLVTLKTLTSGDDTPEEGDTVTFQIEVRNDGPADATGVTLTDLLPNGLTATTNNGTTDDGAGNAVGTYDVTSGVWDIGNLANGDSATLTIEGEVDTGQSSETIENTTTAATGNQLDPSTTGDDLTESVTVQSRADISVTKTNTPGENGEVDQTDDTVLSGSTVTYTIRVTNNGPDSIAGAVVNDTIGSGLTCEPTDPVTLSGDGVPSGSFTIADLTGAGITLGSLDDGQTTILSYSCEVN